MSQNYQNTADNQIIKKYHIFELEVNYPYQ